MSIAKAKGHNRHFKKFTFGHTTSSPPHVPTLTVFSFSLSYKVTLSSQKITPISLKIKFFFQIERKRAHYTFSFSHFFLPYKSNCFLTIKDEEMSRRGGGRRSDQHSQSPSPSFQRGGSGDRGRGGGRGRGDAGGRGGRGDGGGRGGGGGRGDGGGRGGRGDGGGGRGDGGGRGGRDRPSYAPPPSSSSFPPGSRPQSAASSSTSASSPATERSSEVERKLTLGVGGHDPAPSPASTSTPKTTTPASVATPAVKPETAPPPPPSSSTAITFPRRPSFGTIGRKIMVRANHFLVQVADKSLYHYDVYLSLSFSL